MNRSIRQMLLLLCVLLIQSCGGGGGGGSSGSGATPPTPLSVVANSFVNKSPADLSNFLVPDLSQITGNDGYSSIANTLAVADFFQSGQYSAFVVGAKTVNATRYVRAYFLKYDTSLAKWVDDSSQLFASDSDRIVCDDPRQGLVSEFNGDSKPDVYVVCAAAGGTAQQAFISNTNGKYARQVTNFNADATSAAIADINGDSYVDIVTTDGGSVYRVWGGSSSQIGTSAWFSAANKSLISISQVNNANPPINPFPSSVLSLFLVPRSGDLYLVAGGNGSSGGSSQNVVTWHKNFGGYFNSTSARSFVLPGVIPVEDYRYDYVEQDSNGYIFAVSNSAPNKFLQLFRIAAPAVDSQGQPASGGALLYKYTGTPTYPTPTPASWATRVIIKNGKLVPYDAACQSNPISLLDQRCTQSYALDADKFIL